MWPHTSSSDDRATHPGGHPWAVPSGFVRAGPPLRALTSSVTTEPENTTSLNGASFGHSLDESSGKGPVGATWPWSRRLHHRRRLIDSRCCGGSSCRSGMRGRLLTAHTTTEPTRRSGRASRSAAQQAVGLQPVPVRTCRGPVRRAARHRRTAQRPRGPVAASATAVHAQVAVEPVGCVIVEVLAGVQTAASGIPPHRPVSWRLYGVRLSRNPLMTRDPDIPVPIPESVEPTRTVDQQEHEAVARRRSPVATRCRPDTASSTDTRPAPEGVPT